MCGGDGRTSKKNKHGIEEEKGTRGRNALRAGTAALVWFYGWMDVSLEQQNRRGTVCKAQSSELKRWFYSPPAK
jgi:hypothetical protein